MIEAHVQSGLNIFTSWSYRLLRIVIGGIFIYSGAIKLLDVKGFARMISLYDLVPEQLLAPVAIGLPALELVAGIGILFEIPGALSAIFGMLLMFCSILWYGILQDLDIDCGCFSTAELKGQDSLRQALYRDFVMIAGCFYLYLYRFFRIRRELGPGAPVK
ncbi:MAG: DoxX family membrane protein [Deltaproteobacteria bacterium]|nr:DoxX family membrane protein [Deltaproteobacteria bacterium]